MPEMSGNQAKPGGSVPDPVAFTPEAEVEAVHAQISLIYQASSRELLANISPAQEAHTFSIAQIQERIDDEGFAAIELHDGVLDKLLSSLIKLEFGEYILGSKPEFVDLSFQCNQDNKKLEAVLTLSETPQEYSVALLKATLKEQNLEQYRISDDQLKEVLSWARQKRFGKFPIADKPVYTAVRLELEDESGELKARLFESDTETVFDQAMLSSMLEENGYDEFDIDKEALKTLIKAFRKQIHGVCVIGRRLDAEISFNYNTDRTEVRVHTKAACGGRAIDMDFLLESLDRAGIQTQYCDHSALDQVVAEDEVRDLLIASGAEPEAGDEAKFEALVQPFVYRKPKADEQGSVDINDIKDFIVVEPGEALMRRIPATPGIDGFTVCGEIIPAQAGQELEFDKDTEGAELDPDDPNLLVATTKGHPVIAKAGVKIDKTLVVNNVGTHTGNITFDGSLLVKGEVMGGLEINVTGDLIVKDMVHNSRLEAGNNITVNHGIVGSCKKEIGETDDCEAYIRAGGTITARYISMADMEAGGDIDVREYIAHCKSTAKGQVKLGQAGGKGIISGGQCHANQSVMAKVLGTDSGIKTNVSAGLPAGARTEFQHWKDQLEEKKENARKMVNLLQRSEASLSQQVQQDDHFERKLRNLKIKIIEGAKDIEELCAKIDDYEREKKRSKRSHVSVNSKTYPNVQIDINGAQFTIRQASKGGRFVVAGEDIRWENL